MKSLIAALITLMIIVTLVLQMQLFSLREDTMANRKVLTETIQVMEMMSNAFINFRIKE
jgi:hypothetical protein